jgi:hypothetical protein
MNTNGRPPSHFLFVNIRAIRGSNLFIRNPMIFTIFNTVEQMILAAATSLGSGAGGSFLPRIS